MNNFGLSFFLGIICTLFLFVLSVIITLGVKSLYLMRLDLLKKQLSAQSDKQPTAPAKTSAPKKSKTQTSKKTVKSIEIDPEIVDKIYVKKSG